MGSKRRFSQRKIYFSQFTFIDKYLNISFIMLGLNFDLLYFM